ncbi:MAG: hypothetical protein B6245_08945 [Desulfobacteraceae bacterium 4572_88]|nr:MAG: hypothetical protein B6245_08945 [Desulfobacteraceae bacterium 4572_88]
MRIRIRHWNQWPDKRRNFCRNLFCGLLTMLILHLISYTGIGQDMLNDSYDFLVKTDFRLSIVPGKDAETVSDAIRIVAFDKESCENSPGQGFWTPRELLGRSVIKAIQLGAKVVVVDFALDKPVPSSYYYTDEGFVEENQRYLSLLRQAVNLAEQKGSVILLPWTKRKPEPKGYTAQYYKLMDTNSHVIRQGSPGIFFNTSDFKIRHLRFYEKDRDRVLISLPILAALYQWHGIEKGHKILTDTENSLRNGSEDIITIPSDGSVPGIRLYPQNKSGECLPARLKFRIAPTALVKAYAPEEYNPLCTLIYLNITFR